MPTVIATITAPKACGSHAWGRPALAMPRTSLACAERRRSRTASQTVCFDRVASPARTAAFEQMRQPGLMDVLLLLPRGEAVGASRRWSRPSPPPSERSDCPQPTSTTTPWDAAARRRLGRGPRWSSRRFATIALSPYVARNIWRPMMRSELCCARSNAGDVCRKIELASATYVGRVESSRRAPAARLVAAAATLRDSAPNVMEHTSLEFRAGFEVPVRGVERLVVDPQRDRRDGRTSRNMLRLRPGDRDRRSFYRARSAPRWPERNIVLSAT